MFFRKSWKRGRSMKGTEAADKAENGYSRTWAIYAAPAMDDPGVRAIFMFIIKSFWKKQGCLIFLFTISGIHMLRF